MGGRDDADATADGPRSPLTPLMPPTPTPLMPARAPGEPEGGDPACWLAAVCADCGALREGPGACWRCGAA